MFRPISTQKIGNHLYAVRTVHVNFYIYDTENELMVFDTGIGKRMAESGFKKLKLDPNKVMHVFLTHSDSDHAGGLGLFKNADIFISKKEEPMITHQKARKGIFYNKEIADCHFMEDRETLQIDHSSVTLISSPGHTVGSAMYVIDNEILVTGDTISLSKEGDIKYSGSFQNMNHRENMETVDKLKGEKLFDKMSLIATGHYGILRK